MLCKAFQFFGNKVEFYYVINGKSLELLSRAVTCPNEKEVLIKCLQHTPTPDYIRAHSPYPNMETSVTS